MQLNLSKLFRARSLACVKTKKIHTNTKYFYPKGDIFFLKITLILFLFPYLFDYKGYLSLA